MTTDAKPVKRTAVVVRAHKITDFFVGEFARIKSAELETDVEVFLSFDSAEPIEMPGFSNVHFFSKEDVFQRFKHFDAERPLWHNPDYIILDFYVKNPGYDYYWLIEYDVYFAGEWKDFFSRFSLNNADQITSAIKTPKDIFGAQFVKPEWVWWHALNFEPPNLVGCFFPVNRFSNMALKTLLEAYGREFFGYAEIFVPTIFFQCGLVLDDLYLYPDLCREDGFNYGGPVTIRPGFIHHPVRSAADTRARDGTY